MKQGVHHKWLGRMDATDRLKIRRVSTTPRRLTAGILLDLIGRRPVRVSKTESQNRLLVLPLIPTVRREATLPRPSSLDIGPHCVEGLILEKITHTGTQPQMILPDAAVDISR